MRTTVPNSVREADTTPIPYSLTLAAEALPRTAQILVRGQRLTTECPAWCIVDHSVENLAFLEDLHHEGERISLPLPALSGVTERVMVAQLVQWPFVDGGRTYVSVDADGSGETASLGREGASALVDQLSAYTAHLGRLAAIADGGQA